MSASLKRGDRVRVADNNRFALAGVLRGDTGTIVAVQRVAREDESLDYILRARYPLEDMNELAVEMDARPYNKNGGVKLWFAQSELEPVSIVDRIAELDT